MNKLTRRSYGVLFNYSFREEATCTIQSLKIVSVVFSAVNSQLYHISTFFLSGKNDIRSKVTLIFSFVTIFLHRRGVSGCRVVRF